MQQTIVHIETKSEHLYLKLRNDITSVSLKIKKKKTSINFPLMLIIIMNIKLKIKANIIFISRIIYQNDQKVSL